MSHVQPFPDRLRCKLWNTFSYTYYRNHCAPEGVLYTRRVWPSTAAVVPVSLSGKCLCKHLTGRKAENRTG
jgi:hypothetical protein